MDGRWCPRPCTLTLPAKGRRRVAQPPPPVPPPRASAGRRRPRCTPVPVRPCPSTAACQEQPSVEGREKGGGRRGHLPARRLSLLEDIPPPLLQPAGTMTPRQTHELLAAAACPPQMGLITPQLAQRLRAADRPAPLSWATPAALLQWVGRRLSLLNGCMIPTALLR
jgi:hypothetical protein